MCFILFLQEYEFEGQDDDDSKVEEDLESNIKDLEFKLTHDLDKMQVSMLITPPNFQEASVSAICNIQYIYSIFIS